MRQIDVVSRIDMIASRWPMTSIASGEDNHKEDLKRHRKVFSQWFSFGKRCPETRAAQLRKRKGT